MTPRTLTRSGHTRKFYCPGCGEVRYSSRITRPQIDPHLTGSPTAPPGYGQRKCDGGRPHPEEDAFR